MSPWGSQLRSPRLWGRCAWVLAWGRSWLGTETDGGEESLAARTRLHQSLRGWSSGSVRGGPGAAWLCPYEGPHGRHWHPLSRVAQPPGSRPFVRETSAGETRFSLRGSAGAGRGFKADRARGDLMPRFPPRAPLRMSSPPAGGTTLTPAATRAVPGVPGARDHADPGCDTCHAGGPRAAPARVRACGRPRRDALSPCPALRQRWAAGSQGPEPPPGKVRGRGG